MKRFGFLFLLCGLCDIASALDLAKVLERADEARNPAQSFKLNVLVTAEGEEDSEMEVSIKGRDKTLVRLLKPISDKGKTMLMLGEDMWIYLPKNKKPIRVSLNQKLTGQIANGDISRQRWSGDYDPTLEKEDRLTWVLMLTASRPNLTYDKIRLWIEKKRYRPKKAEYLTKSGKVLKRAVFQGYKQLAGKVRPTELVISNATNDQDKSVIKTTQMTPTEFPDSLFNQNNFK